MTSCDRASRIPRARLALFSLAAAAVILGVAVLVAALLDGLSPVLLFAVQAAVIVTLVWVVGAVLTMASRR